MARRVAIPRLQRAHETIDRRKKRDAQLARLPGQSAFELSLVAGVLVLPAMGAQRRLQGVTKLVQLDRLEEVLMRARVKALRNRIGIVSRCQDDDGDFRPAF